MRRQTLLTYASVHRSQGQGERFRMLTLILFSLLLLVHSTPVNAQPQPIVKITPLKQKSQNAETVFTPIEADALGISFENRILEDHPKASLYTTSMSSAALAAGDVNADGLIDIFIAAAAQDDLLYVQDSQLYFVETGKANGITSNAQDWSTAAVFGDIDNDEDLDLFVCNYDTPSKLYINDGEGNFRNEAEAYEIGTYPACSAAAFADYDRDGLLDLFIVRNRLFSPTETSERYPRPGLPDVLLKQVSQDKGARFVDFSAEAGIDDLAMGTSVLWWDYNADLYPDLFVTNEFGARNTLWKNTADGRFSEVSASVLPNSPWHSFGADFADINGDGFEDLFVAALSPKGVRQRRIAEDSLWSQAEAAHTRNLVLQNALYISDGAPHFQELAYASKVAETGWSWGGLLADFSANSTIDLFISSGTTRSLLGLMQNEALLEYQAEIPWALVKTNKKVRQRNSFYLLKADKQYANSARKNGVEDRYASSAALKLDVDNDGDLDVLVLNFDAAATLYLNQSLNTDQVVVSLRGVQSNKLGIGARVSVQSSTRTQVQTLQTTRGHAASSPAELHFTLPEGERIETLKVQWPSGIVQELDTLPANQHIRVFEEGLPLTEQAHLHDNTPLFTQAPLSFRPQPLASKSPHSLTSELDPYSLTAQASAIAWGDINGRGEYYLFLGGDAGNAGALYRFSEKGMRLVEIPSLAFARDRQHADRAAIFFDVDSDGDLDLFVASGGEGLKRNSPMLLDRLYINTGKHTFLPAPVESLPNLASNSRTIAAADFDRDGDIDLFIASRNKTGHFAQAGTSYILQNLSSENGKVQFRLLDTKNTFNRSSLGLVTAVLWTDVNADSWLDLLLLRDWDSPLLFLNEAGVFREASEASNLSALRGLWQGVDGADVDNDGDIDYVLANWGNNSPYQASVEKPLQLLASSYPIELREHKGELYPRRGSMALRTGFPDLNSLQASPTSIAARDFNTLFGEPMFQRASRLSVTQLNSMILINDGDARFRARVLPAAAQASPAVGVLASDLNADGLVDIVLTQNRVSRSLLLGNRLSTQGLVLTGSGDGSFQPVSRDKSGFYQDGFGGALSSLDLNADNRPDLLTSVYPHQTRAFLSQSKKRFFSVRFKPSTKQTIPGTRILLKRSDGLIQTAEVYAGSGFLSQNAPVRYFGLGSAEVESLEITWPNGAKLFKDSFKGDSIVLP